MLKKYLYLKLCWARSSSHLSILSTVIEKVLLVGVFLKVFSVNNYALVALGGAVLVALMLAFGHFDLTHGWASQEAHLNNQYNPEMREIVSTLRR